MMVVFIGLMLTSFFTSHYLNTVADSSQRATVLSFKGLALNAAYGFIGVAFAVAIRLCRQELAIASGGDWSLPRIQETAFKTVVGWFPWYLALALALAGLVIQLRLRGGESGTPGSGSASLRNAQFLQHQTERTKFGEAKLKQVGPDKDAQE